MSPTFSFFSLYTSEPSILSFTLQPFTVLVGSGAGAFWAPADGDVIPPPVPPGAAGAGAGAGVVWAYAVDASANGIENSVLAKSFFMMELLMEKTKLGHSTGRNYHAEPFDVVSSVWRKKENGKH